MEYYEIPPESFQIRRDFHNKPFRGDMQKYPNTVDNIKSRVKEPPLYDMTMLKVEEKVSEIKSNEDTNYIYEKIVGNEKTTWEPATGSVVYCDLGPVEHSGIYVGGKKIIDLNGKGEVGIKSLQEFTSHINIKNPYIYAPFRLNSNESVGLYEASMLAWEMKHNLYSRNYNLVMDNCHQFAAGCITKQFNNPNNFLSFLKLEFENQFDFPIVWKKWEWYK